MQKDIFRQQACDFFVRDDGLGLVRAGDGEYYLQELGFEYEPGVPVCKYGSRNMAALMVLRGGDGCTAVGATVFKLGDQVPEMLTAAPLHLPTCCLNLSLNL